MQNSGGVGLKCLEHQLLLISLDVLEFLYRIGSLVLPIHEFSFELDSLVLLGLYYVIVYIRSAVYLHNVVDYFVLFDIEFGDVIDILILQSLLKILHYLLVQF